LMLAVSSGLLVRREGRWELVAAPRDGDSFAALGQGGSVGTLLARRLDGLGLAARALALAGAVRGREWSERDTAAIAGLDEAAALDAIEELLRGQIVVEADGDHLRFVHDRIREAAYDAIAPDERRRLHARTAAALEASPMRSDAATCRALAFHHAQAGAAGRAFVYAERAGREALASGSFREAEELLAQAIALAEASGGAIAPSPDARAQLYRLHADALYAAGDVARARAPPRRSPRSASCASRSPTARGRGARSRSSRPRRRSGSCPSPRSASMRDGASPTRRTCSRGSPSCSSTRIARSPSWAPTSRRATTPSARAPTPRSRGRTST